MEIQYIILKIVIKKNKSLYLVRIGGMIIVTQTLKGNSDHNISKIHMKFHTDFSLTPKFPRIYQNNATVEKEALNDIIRETKMANKFSNFN